MTYELHEKYLTVRRFFVMLLCGVAMLLASGCAGGYYGSSLTSPLGGQSSEWYWRTFTATDSEGRFYHGVSTPYSTYLTDSEGNTIWIYPWSVWDY